ncbi:MAG: leucine-rich repeat domain-containing protein, partial [Clostridia bacterium]|nr:leucine-rich repeat domain-containing protein [Clostridia bacterium]
FGTAFSMVIAEEIAERNDSCGENLTWQIVDTVKLEIVGTGDMTDYNETTDQPRPWESHKYKITQVAISDGVTTIGQRAFEGHDKLYKIELPNSIVVIDDYAFHYCESLRNIVIPADTKVIGRAAFNSCFELDTVSLPDGLQMICDGAFRWCPDLEEIYIPQSVEYIGENVFEYCGDNFTIICSEGSYADKYAQEYGYNTRYE